MLINQNIINSLKIQSQINNDSHLTFIAKIIRDIEPIKLIIEENDIAHKNNHGYNALMLAFRYNNENVCNYLLDYYYKNNYQCLLEQNNLGETILNIAAKSGKICLIEKYKELFTTLSYIKDNWGDEYNR